MDPGGLGHQLYQHDGIDVPTVEKRPSFRYNRPGRGAVVIQFKNLVDQQHPTAVGQYGFGPHVFGVHFGSGILKEKD
jgi:hypothetical protein